MTTPFAFIPERSEATPGLFNRIFSTLSDNIGLLTSGVTLTFPSTQTFSVATNIDVTGNLHATNRIGVGPTPSAVTTGAMTIAISSALSDYIHFEDTSGSKSDYLLGSRVGGTADGLNLWDLSGNTMLVSFSKQSIRFFQNVVGPVFDVGGALADTLNAATFGTGADSNESRIQSAINQASVDATSRVYVPANMYPYSASSMSFIFTVQMVREGGEWNTFDAIAYGAYANGIRSDSIAIQSAISGAARGGGIVRLPAQLMISSIPIRMLGNVNMLGSGWSTVIRTGGGPSSIINISSITSWAIADVTFDGRLSSATALTHGILLNKAGTGLLDNVRVVNISADGMNGTQVDGIKVSRCVVSNCSEHGMLFGNSTGFPASRHVQIINSEIGNCQKQGVYFFSEIRDSQIIGSVISGAENGIRLGVGATNSAKSVERIVLNGNICSNCSVDGIRLMGSEIICVGNISSSNSNSGIKSGGNGIEDPQTFTNSVIMGNSASSNSNVGIYLLDRQQDFLTVSDNVVVDNRAQGIRFDSGSSSNGTVTALRITGNTCRHNGFGGIAFSSHTFTRCVIASNTVMNNGWNTISGDGIFLANFYQGIVTGNDCYDDQSTKSQANGIRFGTSASSVIVTGNICLAADHVLSGISLGPLSLASFEFGHNIL